MVNKAGENISVPNLGEAESALTPEELPSEIEGISSQIASKVEVSSKEKQELSPEESENTLLALEARFEANEYVKGKWSDIRASLEADPEALWSAAEMEAAGHEPNVFHYDWGFYSFGTCSKETPESGGNCVYDKEAAEWRKEHYPNIEFNTSSIEMAEAMGVTLMAEHEYDILQEKKLSTSRDLAGY